MTWLREAAKRIVRTTPGGYRAYRLLTTGRSLKRRNIDGFSMHFDVNDGGIGRALFMYGAREQAFMHLLNTEVEPGMIAADLGANIGYTTMYMCKGVGRRGQVFAFEPDPHNVTFLEKNIKANNFGDVTSIERLALSNKPGASKFYIASAPNLNSMTRSDKTVSEIDVTTESLTSFFGRLNLVPNFIKMDVEGHEVEILDGGFGLYKNTSQKVRILLEVHQDTYSEGHSLARQIERYVGIGFHVKYVVSTPVARPKLFAEMGYSPDMTIPAGGRVRGIYKGIPDEDAIRLSCFPHRETTATETSERIVRSIMLEKGG